MKQDINLKGQKCHSFLLHEAQCNSTVFPSLKNLTDFDTSCTNVEWLKKVGELSAILNIQTHTFVSKPRYLSHLTARPRTEY